MVSCSTQIRAMFFPLLSTTALFAYPTTATLLLIHMLLENVKQAPATGCVVFDKYAWKALSPDNHMLLHLGSLLNVILPLIILLKIVLPFHPKFLFLSLFIFLRNTYHCHIIFLFKMCIYLFSLPFLSNSGYKLKEGRKLCL